MLCPGCRQTPGSAEDFNRNWLFHPGDAEQAADRDYDDARWRQLDLPHDWSIEGEFSEDHPTGPAGGGLPAGTGWYRKHFRLEAADNTKRIFVDFDGVYRNSEAWINGHYLGKRANGYISFGYELSPYVLFGDEKNILAVRVDNSLQPNSRWYTGSGIYRKVRLRKEDPVHMEKWGTVLRFPRITKDSARLEAEIALDYCGELPRGLELRTRIVDASGKKAGPVLRTAVGSGSIRLSHLITGPVLWSPEHPVLYTLHCALIRDGRTVDEKETHFGIRYYTFADDGSFLLNGEKLEIRGVNMHHDLGALGAAVNSRAIGRQLEILKGMGVNAIRTAHNPAAPELLDLCDRMGFLVMEEAFDVWRKKKMDFDYHMDFEANYERDLADMVRRDRNHPSIFAWSIGNEIREQFDSTGLELTCELASIVKAHDPTRPVTCALTETDPEKNYISRSGCLDLLGFNYKIHDWKHFPESFPGRQMIATENMSAYATRGHYDMPSDSARVWPRRSGEEIIGPNADFTVSAYDHVHAFWGSSHEATLREYHRHDFIPGIFIWSGFDFLGEPVPYEWPAKSSYYWVVDLAGFPKDVYYLYRSLWTGEPTLHLFPHWNWEEGREVDIWAYYNRADEVELYLNGRSLGKRQKKDSSYHVMWRVPFEAGSVRAVSRKDGKDVMERVIRTSGPGRHIRLSADRQAIMAGGEDLCFVTVSIHDGRGTPVPRADNLVRFSLEGPGSIAGVDNGYQASHESFKADVRRTFHGKCLVIVRPDHKAGTLTLSAESEGLESHSIKIKVKSRP